MRLAGASRYYLGNCYSDRQFRHDVITVLSRRSCCGSRKRPIGGLRHGVGVQIRRRSNCIEAK
jgi:hypothetical protein